MTVRPASVVAVVATMGRPAELGALLASLASSQEPLLAVVVVDNGLDEETRRVAEESGAPTVYLRPEKNLGCGGGLLAGERLVLERFAGEFTHLWVLDDDAIVNPDTLGQLLAALTSSAAPCAMPLVEDKSGLLNWCPGLLDPAKYRVANKSRPPEEYLSLCGSEPVPFSWAQGIALLVTRAALERFGLHRADFWVRGEDLDFSLRLTQETPGLWVPATRVRHWPPASSERPEFQYVRYATMLQNIAYIALRLPHGRRIARTLPGNWFRFFGAGKWKPRVLWEGTRAFFRGAVLGWPAGHDHLKDV